MVFFVSSRNRSCGSHVSFWCELVPLQRPTPPSGPFRQGERLLTKGCRLGAAELGILAALGMRRAWGGTERAEPSERDGPEAAATGDLVMSGSFLFF